MSNESRDRHAEERHAAAMRTLDTIEETSRKIGERIDAQKRIAQLEAMLRECREWFAEEAESGTAGSDAWKMRDRIDALLGKPDPKKES